MTVPVKYNINAYESEDPVAADMQEHMDAGGTCFFLLFSSLKLAVNATVPASAGLHLDIWAEAGFGVSLARELGRIALLGMEWVSVLVGGGFISGGKVAGVAVSEFYLVT